MLVHVGEAILCSAVEHVGLNAMAVDAPSLIGLVDGHVNLKTIVFIIPHSAGRTFKLLS